MHSKLSMDPTYKDFAKKILLQGVLYHKEWYIVQVYLEGGNKTAAASPRDNVSIVMYSTKQGTGTYTWVFSVQTLIENIRKYVYSSYSSFFQTRQLPQSAQIQFLQRLKKVITFKKNEVKISGDYIKQDTGLQFSFDENISRRTNAFQDNFHFANRKRKNDSHKRTDLLFEENYNEIYDKYFLNRKNVFVYENMDDSELIEEGKLLIDSDDEIQTFDDEGHEEGKQDSNEMHGIRHKHSYEDELVSVTERIKMFKPRYYFKYQLENSTWMYLRIDLIVGKAKDDSIEFHGSHIVISGYRPMKGQVYYKNITSQKFIVNRNTSFNDIYCYTSDES